MPQDFFTLNYASRELKNLILGAKVQKITMPTDFEAILTVYNGETRKLIISCNAVNSRVGLTTSDKKNPLIAKNFCMLLRKHLLGSKITDVSLANNDRIYALSFDNETELKERVSFILYAEIMNKYSNVFLTANGVILGSMRTTPQSLDGGRITLTGAKYAYPDKQNKLNVYNCNLANVYKNYKGTGLSNFILNTFSAFSPVTSEELSYRILLKGDFTVENAVKATNEFISQNLSPIAIFNGKSYDYYPFTYLTVAGDKTPFNLLTLATDYAVTQNELKQEFSANKNAVLSKITAYEKKQLKNLSQVNEKILECESADKIRLYAELLTANCYAIKKGLESVTLLNYYSEKGETVTIKIDKNLTANENAQKYYKKYSKLKKTLEKLTPRKQIYLDELSYVDGLKFQVENAVTVTDLLEINEELISLGISKSQNTSTTKKKVVSYGYREYKIENFTVKVGKNNVQNDALTFSASRTDIWLHAKNYHSAHVIIETGNQPVPPTVLLKAAEITAYYSTGKNGDKIPVDYTFKKHVKKQPNAKPGAVIYTDFKTLLVTPNPHENLLV